MDPKSRGVVYLTSKTSEHLQLLLLRPCVRNPVLVHVIPRCQQMIHHVVTREQGWLFFSRRWFHCMRKSINFSPNPKNKKTKKEQNFFVITRFMLPSGWAHQAHLGLCALFFLVWGNDFCIPVLFREKKKKNFGEWCVCVCVCVCVRARARIWQESAKNSFENSY